MYQAGWHRRFITDLSQQKFAGTGLFVSIDLSDKIIFTKEEKDMTENKIPYKIYLNEDEMPKRWYNLRADMKNKPAPLVNPGTGEPMKAEELEAVFCKELVEQELDNDTPYIDIPEEIGEYLVLKLLLQPLVENALYHGIKNRRGGGTIRVSGRLEDKDLVFTVKDTGSGMTPEKLRLLNERMIKGQPSVSEGSGGFGLVNVNLRIRLYYNLTDGLKIESSNSGTTVSFRVPCMTREEIYENESVSGG